jgi:hypothetical protein
MQAFPAMSLSGNRLFGVYGVRGHLSSTLVAAAGSIIARGDTSAYRRLCVEIKNIKCFFPRQRDDVT